MRLELTLFCSFRCNSTRLGSSSQKLRKWTKHTHCVSYTHTCNFITFIMYLCQPRQSCLLSYLLSLHRLSSPLSPPSSLPLSLFYAGSGSGTRQPPSLPVASSRALHQKRQAHEADRCCFFHFFTLLCNKDSRRKSRKSRQEVIPYDSTVLNDTLHYKSTVSLY